MFETMVAFNWIEHLGGETFVPPEGDMGYARVLSPHRRPYATKDGYLALMPYTNAHWQRFFTLGGRPELAHDPRFLDPAARSRNVGELYALLAEMVAERTTDEWLFALADADIPMTRVLSGKDLVEAGLFDEWDHPSEGRIRLIGMPVRFSRTPGSVRRMPPVLGADRDDILEELE